MITAEEKDTIVTLIQHLYKDTYYYEEHAAYNEGYNQALLDVIKIVESVNTDAPQAEWVDTTEWIGF